MAYSRDYERLKEALINDFENMKSEIDKEANTVIKHNKIYVDKTDVFKVIEKRISDLKGE